MEWKFIWRRKEPSLTVRIRLKRQKRRSSFLKSGCSCGGFEAVLRKRTKKKSPENRLVTGLFGGELGIRTLEAFRLTAFRVLHLRPLGQLSVYVIPFSFEKLFARTDGKNNKIFNFRTEENPWIYGLFKRSKQPTSQKISSFMKCVSGSASFVLVSDSFVLGARPHKHCIFRSKTQKKSVVSGQVRINRKMRQSPYFWKELRKERKELRTSKQYTDSHTGK